MALKFPDDLLPFLTPGETSELDQILASTNAMIGCGGSVPTNLALRLRQVERVDAICRDAEARMADHRARGTSILLRFRRVTYEHTFVKVPVVGDMVKDGTLNFDALVVAGAALAKDSRWELDSELAPEVAQTIEPHPIQMPLPEDWKS